MRIDPATVVRQTREYFDLNPVAEEGPAVYVVQQFHPQLGGWGPGVLFPLNVSAVKELQRQGFTAIGVIQSGGARTADFQLDTVGTGS